MDRPLIVFLALVAVFISAGRLLAEEAPPAVGQEVLAPKGDPAQPAAETPGTTAAAPAAAPEPAPPEPPPATTPAPETPSQAALREKLATLPAGTNDEETNEHQALVSFYAARANLPLWFEAGGPTAKAREVVAAIGNARDWGLDPRDFSVPATPAASNSASEMAPIVVAESEVSLSLAILKYARYARGGRIIAPSESLNSNLDRRPQLLKPADVLQGMATADSPGAYLSGTNPKHSQFERLRQKYLAALKGKGDTKRLLANMEMWRWMYDDMGDLYVLANIPEFMLRVEKNGETIWTERIVAGEVGKQSSIFTRRLKEIVFRPKWRVPESIKVLELWPSLKHGGGLMRQYGLEIETKDGRPLDWRTMNWNQADIRNYEVVQPPGRKSVLGVVKFSFPSQHTIYMHDTPDKWMFNQAQRTLSHGCLRVRNPVHLAELLLAEDKGWDAAKIADLIRNGPLNNEVAIDKKIPIHLVYFTAWVDDSGRLETYRDIYGHEKRVTLALEGRWSEINKGRDHLAPVEPAPVAAAPVAQSRRRESTIGDALTQAISGGFF